MISNSLKSEPSLALLSSPSRLSRNLAFKMKVDSSSANLAISWGVCFKNLTSLRNAKTSMKFYSRAFIPVKFLSSISKLYKNLFSNGNKSAGLVKTGVSLANDFSSAASSSVNLFTLCDAVSFKSMEKYQGFGSKMGSFGSVTSLISGATSIFLNCIGLREKRVSLHGVSSRRQNSIKLQHSQEKYSLMTNLCYFSSSIVSFVARYAFFAYSPLVSTAFQTIPFLFTVKKGL